MAIHGISVFEVKKTSGKFAYVQNSAFNFRIHQNTPVEIHGPARGNSAAGHQVLARWHHDPRHAEQLRHRQDALGHAC
jgi:secreted PhoX family phosphatase